MPALPTTLRLRQRLIQAITERLERQSLTRAKAAELLGVAHPRAVDLFAGRAERFSLDALVTLAENAGLTVRVSATRPYRRS